MTDDITLPGVLSLVGWAGVLMVRLLAHSWLSGLSPRVLGRCSDRGVWGVFPALQDMC